MLDPFAPTGCLHAAHCLITALTKKCPLGPMQAPEQQRSDRVFASFAVYKGKVSVLAYIVVLLYWERVVVRAVARARQRQTHEA